MTLANFKNELETNIQILLSSITLVNNKIYFVHPKIKKDGGAIIDLKSNTNNIKKLASIWYEWYYGNKIAYVSNDSSNTFSKELWQISLLSNPIGLNQKWVVNKIINNNEVLQVSKGFENKSFEIKATIPDKPYKIIEENDFVGILDNSGFQFETDDTWIYLYGKSKPQSFDDIVRFYFNLTINNSDRIIELVNKILEEFNKKNVIFGLKLLAKYKRYNRADSMVVYVEKRSFRNSYYILKDIHASFEDICREQVPMFTLKLGKGWGFAEEPVTEIGNNSFGQDRIFKVSEVIYKLITAQKTIPIIGDVLKKLENKDKLFLNKDSKLNIAVFEANAQVGKVKDYWKVSNEYLDIASDIGFKLATQAIWKSSSEECLWLKLKKTPETLFTKSCGEKTYGGSIGIALFYCNLFSLKPEPLFMELAKGALINATSVFNDNFDLNVAFKRVKIDGFDSFFDSYFKIHDILGINTDNSKSEINKLDSIIDKFFDEPLTIEHLQYLKYKYFIKKIWNRKQNLIDEILYLLDTTPPYNATELVSALINISFHSLDRDKYKTVIITIQEKLITENKSINFSKLGLVKFIYFFKLRLKLFSFFCSNGIENKNLNIESLFEYFSSKICVIENDKNLKFNYQNDGILYLLETFDQITIASQFTHFPKKKMQFKFADILINEMKNEYFKFGQFPPGEFGHSFYNPGLIDGIAGLGYFFLLKYMPEKIKPLTY